MDERSGLNPWSSLAESGEKIICCSREEDFPDDLDLDAWCREALCFTLFYPNELKFYAVNPNDYFCYHLADFSFSGLPFDFLAHHLHRLASCTLIGHRLYLLGRTDRKDYFKTSLWIWDLCEARKKKMEGEVYEWELGPPLNSAKHNVLTFTLGGYLYALDIGRAFWPPFDPTGTIDLNKPNLTREENPCDFECLPVKSNSEGTQGWSRLPPLHIEQYGDLLGLDLIGRCCLQDSKFLLHMVRRKTLEHYLFCFDVTDGKWTTHIFSGLPLSSDVVSDPEYDDPEYDDPEYDDLPESSAQQRLHDGYCAKAQNHSLFFEPFTDKLCLFNFSHVFDMLRKPDFVSSCNTKFPYSYLKMDDLCGLDYFDTLEPTSGLEMWQSYQLEDRRFCCLAFLKNTNRQLYLWACNIDLVELEQQEPFPSTGDLEELKLQEEPIPSESTKDEPILFARDGAAKI